MKLKLTAITIAAILLFGCNSKKETVDSIYINGKIYTVNNNFDIVESFVIKNGKIIDLGSNSEMLSKYESTNKVDFDGKFVYPGLIDAHCHFFGYGNNLNKADLVGTKSFDEIIERLKAHHEKFKSEWLLGRGWDQNDWEIKAFPNKSELDAVFPNTPVLLTRVDGHAAIANTEALKRAGVSNTSQIDGGEFIKQNGELTGVLIDNAISEVRKIIPESSEQEKATALLEAQQNCFAVGLTSVADAGLDKSTIDIIDSLQKNNELKMRVYAMLSPTEENFTHFVENGPVFTEKLTISSIKLFADGALGSRGALMLEPYSDAPDKVGLLVEPEEKLRKICQYAYENNYQINTHAIGDSANRLMLTIYGDVLKEKNDRRWRIEHAQIIHPDDFDLFGKYSIIPSIQTTHATSDMYWAEERVGSERIKGAYAYLQLLQQSGWLPNGSDFPVEYINPLFGFYAGVVRRDQEYYPENGFQMENALSREQALRAMTIWAAKANFEENIKGSLEPGKVADFVVLENDIMEMDEKDLFSVKVLKTFVDGELVYTR